MSLSPAQLATLKAAILADPVLAAKPLTSAGANEIAVALNQPSSPADNVWRTEAPVQAIIDSIDWSKFTPVDTPDGTAIYTNRLLSIQTKQMNLQSMLIGRDSVDASKANIRAGLRDAVIALPAGAGGAGVTAGGLSGATVLSACVRNSLRVEAILASGTAQTGTVSAKLLGYEGTVSSDDVQQARELP